MKTHGEVTVIIEWETTALKKRNMVIKKSKAKAEAERLRTLADVRSETVAIISKAPLVEEETR